jgi:hypothetical protein
MKITLRPGDTLEVECEPPVGTVVAMSRYGYMAGRAADIATVKIEMPPPVVAPEPIRAQLPPAIAAQRFPWDGGGERGRPEPTEDRRVPRYEDQPGHVTSH